MNFEAAGEVIHAGLVATAVTDQPTETASESHAKLCTDCGAPTTGNFCSNCGQATHSHRTLLHLAEELLHGVFHFDARIWRTLPLLAFNPGRLTREWIQGKRTRYVSPLALFLFTIFLLFFVFTLVPHSEQPRPVGERVAEARADLAEAKADFAAAQSAASAAKGAIRGEDGAATGALIAASAALAAKEREFAAVESEKNGKPRDDGLEPGTWQADLRDSLALGKVKVNTGNKDFDKKILHKLQNPDLAVYKIQQTAYKFAFLLIPFSIPLLALLFVWKRGVTLYDHGVFVLYSMTYVAILSMVLGLINNQEWASFAVFPLLLTVPLHMFFQLKGTYALSLGSALWRSLALLIFSAIVVGLFLVTIVFLGLTG